MVMTLVAGQKMPEEALVILVKYSVVATLVEYISVMFCMYLLERTYILVMFCMYLLERT